ncbi:MAG: acyl-CoA thioesterase [Epsilonproteobacteria bacterium]|nr:acyl-CoA thioesterase [Campylobacterota bacterium]
MEIFEKNITITRQDIDFNGHVNNLKYLEWMINSAMLHSRKKGFDEKYYANKGVSWVARKHTIEYKSPAFEGDKLILKTWIDEIKRVSVIRKYEILKDNKIVAKGESEWVFVNSEFKPIRVFEEIAKEFV